MRPGKSPWSAPSWSRKTRGPDAPPGPPRPRRRAKSDAHQPRLVEAIADAAHGFNELAGLAQFLPQALDVHVDRPFEDDGILADGRVHQLVAREGPSGLADQDLN